MRRAFADLFFISERATWVTHEMDSNVRCNTKYIRTKCLEKPRKLPSTPW